MSGAVQSVGKAADDDCTALCQCPADVCRCIQAVFCRPAASHDADRARFIEPARVAGAVEHQRHVRNAGKGQRVIRVIKGQDAHTEVIAPHDQCVILFRVQLLCAKRGSIPGCSAEFSGVPRFPRFLRTAKRIQHTARVDAGRAQHVGQPQPAQQRVRRRLRRKKAGLPGKFPHRLSSRKCHSRMLPAMPAFRLSTRSVMGMRTVLVQAAIVASVRPCPSLPMTTQTPPG